MGYDIEHSLTDISFCLPVYNVKEYVGECIESILNQGNGKIEFEILCIDDCSSDGTYNELISIANSNNKIRVLQNNHNMGVSATRNRLIAEAKGKYIWFVDPDDMLYPNVVFNFWKIAEANKAEVVLGNYIRFNNRDEIRFQVQSTNSHIEQKEFLPHDNRGVKMCAVWAGLFSKDFLNENNLKFQEGMIAQEDTL